MKEEAKEALKEEGNLQTKFNNLPVDRILNDNIPPYS